MRKYFLTLGSIAVGLLVLLAHIGAESSNITGKNQSSDSLRIGDEHAGGIVAYIFKPGDPGYVGGSVNGIVVAPSDQGRAQWGCAGRKTDVTNAALGSGRENTESIVRFHAKLRNFYTKPQKLNPKNDGSVAAKICQELELNGYSDWYLPSKDEFDIIYNNLHKNGLGNFANDSYWSSTEAFASSAWGQLFSFGYQDGYEKTYSARIRAVRTF